MTAQIRQACALANPGLNNIMLGFFAIAFFSCRESSADCLPVHSASGNFFYQRAKQKVNFFIRLFKGSKHEEAVNSIVPEKPTQHSALLLKDCKPKYCSFVFKRNLVFSECFSLFQQLLLLPEPEARPHPHPAPAQARNALKGGPDGAAENCFPIKEMFKYSKCGHYLHEGIELALLAFAD